MVEKVIGKGWQIALLFGLIMWPAGATAHRLDEYLQATLLAIEPEKILLQINLTPGVAVAEGILDRIDRDHDGLISTNEAAAYAESVRHDLGLTLNRREVKLKLTASYFPEAAELRSGMGIIQLEFTGVVDSLSEGKHKLRLNNRHLPAISVYLFNAAQPSSEDVKISKQSRNEQQSDGEIDFEMSHLREAGRPAL